ncbi:diguanylate cyclase [Rhizobiales bacterium RZME27]|uniref:diguanylate cyclase n=1 Tax=Endobacterium cereale TaxID=2663029 RepID=A0A6A8AE29_9HYPH|nr:GGDEF domain-containing protein [Endobacterium cereale]MEB2845355.1 GGDEF domain-containing protein [Endobacterium cereale]MQY49014.1 diguanylate cyclase [Endobacterium cereale]
MSLLPLLLNIIGLMALVAMCLGSTERLNPPPLLKGFVLGLPFAAAACITMMMPVVLPDGTVINGRSLFLAFAAAFGGFVPYLVAALIALVGHMEITDLAVGQAIRPSLCAGVVGLGWRFFVYPRFGMSIGSLLLLGLIVSGLALLLLFVSSGQGLSLFMQTYPATLVGSLAAALILGTFIDREMRHLSEARLWQEQAYTDALTSLANKRAFYEATAALSGKTSPFSILVIDVDHFKKINDTHGHDVGDLALKAIAASVSATLAGRGRAFRLGGEEFVALLPGVQSQQGLELAEAIRHAVAGLCVDAGGRSVRATVSIGIADNSDAQEPPHVVSAADAALYLAKAGGRNRSILSGDVSGEPVVAVQERPAMTKVAGDRA